MEQYYHQTNLDLRKQYKRDHFESEDAYDTRIYKLQRLIKNIDLTKHILDAKDVYDRFLYRIHVPLDLRKIILHYFGPSNIDQLEDFIDKCQDHKMVNEILVLYYPNGINDTEATVRDEILTRCYLNGGGVEVEEIEVFKKMLPEKRFRLKLNYDPNDQWKRRDFKIGIIYDENNLLNEGFPNEDMNLIAFKGWNYKYKKILPIEDINIIVELETLKYVHTSIRNRMRIISII